tara:strand:+ start:154 stop:450 length:297 start_codon:yes stop_codon:yes gene_type:complete
MSDRLIKNLNDAILDVNSACQFENKAPYTDYSKIVWLDGSPTVSKADAEARMAELQTAEDNKVAKAKTDAKAGNDKLIELGLSQDQVTAMTGYTPPSE